MACSACICCSSYITAELSSVVAPATASRDPVTPSIYTSRSSNTDSNWAIFLATPDFSIYFRQFLREGTEFLICMLTCCVRAADSSFEPTADILPENLNKLVASFWYRIASPAMIYALAMSPRSICIFAFFIWTSFCAIALLASFSSERAYHFI